MLKALHLHCSSYLLLFKRKMYLSPPLQDLFSRNATLSHISLAKWVVGEMQMSFYNSLYLLPQHLQEMKSPIVGVFFINSWYIGVVFLTTLLIASCRVEMQKMKVVRPPADVARYTMIFHNRDHGNEENRERWVKNRFLPGTVLVCAEQGSWGTSSLL